MQSVRQNSEAIKIRDETIATALLFTQSHSSPLNALPFDLFDAFQTEYLNRLVYISFKEDNDSFFYQRS
ncbi:hypothetical protein ACRWQM_02835 [Shewanella sp. HL-SH5]|uniref:hypothetical protein n=1 Tax=Shewanella sp. HL-SH5 TaxID=3436241 RepID=UPI003EBCC1E8